MGRQTMLRGWLAASEPGTDERVARRDGHEPAAKEETATTTATTTKLVTVGVVMKRGANGSERL